ncbi:MAG: 2-hydroxychromene-2-carboxylate isomerase [Bradymonadia bacterium]
MTLEFYYDIVCPYAYIASTRVEALAARAGVSLTWCPVLLGGVFKAHQSPQFPGDAMGPGKARLNLLDIHRYAAHHGVPLEMPEGHPRRTVEAMRLILAAPETVRSALSHDLFRAYWIEGADIADRSVLAGIGARHGVPIEAIDGPEIKQALFDAVDAAVAHNIFGVPTFRLGGEGGSGEMWWGQDRMPLVEAAARAAGGGGPKVEIFHDFASPFSYLASTQVGRITRRRGLTLTHRPILLGAMFRDIGTPNVPMMAMSPAKRAHAGQDILRWADWWGVTLRWPSAFPLRTVAPLRVALQAPELTDALYRAAWVDDVNIGDPEALRGVIVGAGGDAEALLSGTQNPEIKAQLKANTEAAIALGACGVPTVVITAVDGTQEIFWGQDRLPLIEATLDRML